MDRRLASVSLILFFCFSLLILRFFSIQILEGDKWENQAKLQHQFALKEPYKRGSFFSNVSIKAGHPQTPVPLVFDVSCFHLYIDPKAIPPLMRDEISQQLISLLHVPKKERKVFAEQFEKPSRSRKLMSYLENAQKNEIEKWWRSYARKKKVARNAVYFIQDYKRSHPFGKLLGQVLHTVREKRDEVTKRAVPTGGLELQFQNLLEGKEGSRLLLRSPRYSLENDQMVIKPQNGADVFLTINHVLQAIAEEELEKGVKAAKAKGGYAVMMDPYSGEILALAEYPFFYPEKYKTYFNDAEKAQQTKIKAISDCNEPGSTFKPITAALALIASEELASQGKKPLVSIEEVINTNKGNFPGRTKPIKDVRFHKRLNMYMAIQKSSNVYVATLAKRIVDQMGEKWYHDKLASLFGFGQKSHIELPSESPGFLPDIGKTYANGTLQWSTPTPYSLAMGYNLLTTGLQMVKAYSILVNGGFMVKPSLVQKISKSTQSGEEILYQNQYVPQQQLLSSWVSREIINMLEYSTKPGGCGVNAQIPGFTEGGKSGTSEKIVGKSYSTKIHFSSFIGIAPTKGPRFVLYVGIDEPEYKFIPGVGRTHFGGRSAAPVFREIAKRTLEYLGVPPDDPHDYPLGDPRSNLKKAHFGKETQELKSLYDKLNG